MGRYLTNPSDEEDGTLDICSTEMAYGGGVASIGGDVAPRQGIFDTFALGSM